jgi:hypothetical protein
MELIVGVNRRRRKLHRFMKRYLPLLSRYQGYLLTSDISNMYSIVFSQYSAM